MNLRRVSDADADALVSFDLGAVRNPWLAEVAEIVRGLVAWERDPDQFALDRQVFVLEDSGEIVAAVAHERLQTEDGHVLETDRYLMVTACRVDRQRSGLARLLVESVLVDMQRNGVRTVRWLVHPSNTGSLAFSRRVFPDADETNPPEDRPYVAFSIRLI